MKRALAVFTMVFVLAVPALAGAHDYTQGTLRIDHPWARFTPPGAPNGAAYLTIENKGDRADRLTGVATPRAERAELHRSEMEGELMTMKPVDGVDIAPGETVSFAPGGLHIMMLGLGAPLTEGERFPMTLRFEHAGEVSIEVVVQRAGPMKMDDDHGQMDHDGDHGHHGDEHQHHDDQHQGME